MPWMQRLLLSVALVGLVASPAAAQQVTIRYDDVAQDVDAAITCGFCAMEKFGTIFYELPGGGGLPASAFPLTLDSVEIAVAGTQVTGDLLTGYSCSGLPATAMISATMEVYAGAMVPTTITNFPGNGAWPNEVTVVPPSQVMLERSRDTMPGLNQWEVRINQLMVGASVPQPNTYLRVVFTVPGGGTSASCSDLGFTPPGLSPFRDNNSRVGPRRNFIYQLGLTIPELMINQPPEWTWSEAVRDPITGMQGINGDWLIRLQVTPAGIVSPDAGVPDTGVEPDAGSPDSGAVADAGPPPFDDGGLFEDAGAEDAAVAPDAGAPTGDAPTITDISPDRVTAGRSVDVTVIGTNFVDGLSLRIGQIPASVEAVNGASTIEAEVPAGIAVGTYDVVVSNPDGQSAILSDGFTVTGTSTGGGGGPTLSSSGCRAGGSDGSWIAVLGLGLLWIRRRRSNAA